MTYDENVIVLNFTKIKENMIVLHCLGQSLGRRSFLIRAGARSQMAYYLPLNIIGLSVSNNPKSDLWTAKPVGSEYPLNGIRGNVFKNAMSLFMAEVLYRTVKEGAKEEGLYEWCVGQIVALDSILSDFSNFHLRFLLGLCTALGFAPSSEDMSGFCGKNADAVTQLMTLDLAASMLVPLNGVRRSEIAYSIIKYLEFHTESAINVRSLDILHDLFYEMK